MLRLADRAGVSKRDAGAIIGEVHFGLKLRLAIPPRQATKITTEVAGSVCAGQRCQRDQEPLLRPARVSDSPTCSWQQRSIYYRCAADMFGRARPRH